MYAAVMREGQIVSSPSGREWEVLGMRNGIVQLRDTNNGELMDIHPKYLRHVFTPAHARPIPLEAIGGAA